MPITPPTKFIKYQALANVLDVEMYILLAFFLVSIWLFYKFFLREVSDERHRNIKTHFSSLSRHFVIMTILFSTFAIMESVLAESIVIQKIMPYLAILTFVSGSIFFVKASRLLVLQYLFLGSMRAGVPLLLVNIFSLLLSLALGLWGANLVLGIQIGPLLATSAAFSIVLGLALQDTLGNLFAGIALQVDKNFQIGDWLEITNGTQKTVGQVVEISWRSTVLLGWTDELISIPNKILSQSQLANYSRDDVPIARSQMFRLPYNIDQNKVREILLLTTQSTEGVLKNPGTLVLISESTESWLGFKVVYYIKSFGSQYIIGDHVLRNGWSELQKAGITPQATRIQVLNSGV